MTQNTETFQPLNGFEISGCAVRRWNIISFWGQEWTNPDPLEVRSSRIYFYYPDEPVEERWAYREIGQARGVRGCAAFTPEERWVFIADDGAVYAVGGGVDGFEASITSRAHYFFSNVKCIQSGNAYAVGPRRKVYVRESADGWHQLESGLFPQGDQTALDSSGFSDVDGFDNDDIYACGGSADLWHYDGTAWKRVDVPTNSNLYRVCCAPDGLVYILTSDRWVLAGRNASWSVIDQDLTTARFESIVVFGNRVILSTESGLFEIVDGDLRLASLPPKPPMRSNSFLAARDGVLVVAGSRDACSFDGQSWSVIFKS